MTEPTALIEAMRLVVGRELTLAWRRWDEVTQPLIFYLVVTTLFPLATSPDLAVLRTIGAGVVWVAALLSSLLALESVFRSDVEDGTMEQWVLSGQPLSWLLFAKVVAHWLLTGLPLVVVSPAVAAAMGLPASVLGALLGSLALGTATLSVLGGIGAALTVGVRRGSTVSAQATGERMVGVVQVHGGDPAIPFVAKRIRAHPDLYR